jgi:hypothetical protein
MAGKQVMVCGSVSAEGPTGCRKTLPGQLQPAAGLLRLDADSVTPLQQPCSPDATYSTVPEMNVRETLMIPSAPAENPRLTEPTEQVPPAKSNRLQPPTPIKTKM